jgi:prepilin-type N-terminal cleavage/methylation domain-containing protein
MSDHVGSVTSLTLAHPRPHFRALTRSWCVRSGFTLVELLVVLVVMGLMVGLVAPSIIPRQERDERDSLAPVVRFAREAAVRRSETVHLSIDPSGAWRVDATSATGEPPLATGRVEHYAGGRATLIVSPIGTCAPDAASARAAQAFDLDPLTCELRAGARSAVER